ncbi:MAG: hypothetical protein A3F84_27850 [Candidatus Handelsmanbacteria bacterium RIFCSPLOWO2_12_FULL_64_10]|uniref:4Fe-4S Mo/W bis-MGD-type domain-containing protein n=1 Tax=Handelsmanbacteria sp. (strain RIFCSPLOWO2_12_FULL_64_10) TaxID=1817868 RepID=A0A1F6C494_HANXR|nr:MAG: hypothetical protein A3F84_27850 [Candidatus Handelsmanbacteria bacterium RIFCSPLOWO2_12_FULL_64_10]
MPGRTTRRSVLKFLAGSAVALPFTPMPYKLLDDTAIWTQTWDRIPKLPRGEITTRFTTCTLCPAACAVRARCVGGRPVGLSGVAGHPLGIGAPCPLGLGAHLLPYHPRRLMGPVARFAGGGLEPTTIHQVIAALAAAIRTRGRTGTSVALLDARPGRALSALYRRLLSALPDGVYLTSPAGEEAWWRRLRQMLDRPFGPLGYDLEKARTILSFGAPVLDGWGAPGRVFRVRFGANERRPRLIQVETRPSRTALFADRWLPVRPGAEGALALGLAHVIVRERLYDEAGLRARALDFETGAGDDYVSLIASFPPERVSRLTGLPPEEIVDTARRFATDGPAIAVAEGDPGGGPLGPEEEVAIWGLNLLVGGLGRPGGIVPTSSLPDPPGLKASDAPPPVELTDVPDGALRVLILDGAPSGSALPWGVLRRKLTPDALVVSLSPYLVGHARRATCVLPAPAYLEGFEEAPTPPGAGRASMSLSAPLIPRPDHVADPVEVIRRLAQALDIALPGSGGSAALIEARAAALQATARGQVFHPAHGGLTPVSGLGPPEALYQSLCDGAQWLDDELEIAPVPRFRLLGPEEVGFRRLTALADGPSFGLRAGGDAQPLTLMPFALRGTAGEGPVPPLTSKLYRESELREGPGSALMRPETGRAYGVCDGGRVRVQTAHGQFEARAIFDASVAPGVAHVAVGPDPDRMGEAGENAGERVLDLCVPDGRGTWRAVPARLWRA